MTIFRAAIQDCGSIRSRKAMPNAKVLADAVRQNAEVVRALGIDRPGSRPAGRRRTNGPCTKRGVMTSMRSARPRRCCVISCSQPAGVGAYLW